MFEDLKNAGDNLRSALVRYITVCSKLRGRTLQDRVSHGTSRELDDQIRKEVEYFDQYKTQLQGVLHSLRVARNSARSIAPINALPAEILVHIFHLVSGSRIRTIKHLTHVCSQWRSVSLSCCFLWTQINYCPREDPALQPKLLNQVRTYLFRVGQLPLRISICLGNFSDKWYDIETKSLFESCAARMQVLELEVFPVHKFESTIRLSNIQSDFLKAFLLKSDPVVFTGLITVVSHFTELTWPPHHSHIQPPLTFHLTTEQFDAIFARVRVLDLHGLFPSWASTAYHNLVDLRLTPALDSPFAITEAALVSILVMSPRLRILHLGLNLIDSPTATSVASEWHVPVNLVDLEVLRICCSTNKIINVHDNAEDLLSLLAPGKKALRVFLEGSGGIAEWREPTSMEQTRAFFERSNVTELYARSHLVPLELLSSVIVRNLRLLVLEDCNVHYGVALVNEDSTQVLSSWSPLETLQINECSMSLAELRSRLQILHVQKLLLHQNTFYLHRKPAPEEKVRADLSAVCATVVFANTPALMSFRH